MINIKNKYEIERMRKGGNILAKVLKELLENVRPGVSELELDRLAEKLIKKYGAEPGFKKVPGYNYSICVSTNDVVVHGVPADYKFKEGDIVGIDVGVFYEGFHTDMAETIIVSNQKSKIKNQKNKEIESFLETGKKALNAGINKARPGNRVGHISKSIQEIVEGAGYAVVKSLVGHGVGKDLHEEPEVPGYLVDKIEATPSLKPGMTIAIEVIYNVGSDEVMYKGEDNWTISSADTSISGLFERTVVITEKGPEILTK